MLFRSLGAIKGTGEAAVESIIAARQSGGKFTGLLDFCERVGKEHMNRRMIGYEFDENGKEQLMNSEFYAEFDKKGMNTKMQAKNGGTVINYVDKRDEKGNLIESDSRDASNTSMSKNTYEYDERGNRVRQDVITPDGSVFMSRQRDRKSVV